MEHSVQNMENCSAHKRFISQYSTLAGPSDELLHMRVIGLRETPTVLDSSIGSPMFFMLFVYENCDVILDKKRLFMPANSLIVIEPKIPYQVLCGTGKTLEISWARVTGSAVRGWFENYGILLNHPLPLQSGFDFENGLVQLNRELRHPLGCSHQAVRQLFAVWLLQLERATGERAKDLPPVEFLQVREHLENYFENSTSLLSIQRACGMSKTRLCVGFRQHFGCSPMEFVTQLRMHYAVELMATTALRIGDVATQCGYEDALYFSKVFKKFYGQSPTAYRVIMRDG